MANCEKLDCYCEFCSKNSNQMEPIQVEHNIRVTHYQKTEIQHKAPRKSSNRVVSIAGDCLNDPESCSIEDTKSMAASLLSVSQGHKDPVYKLNRVYVEEYLDEDYDDEDDDWEEYESLYCACGNLAAMDCENGSCGNCCGGCSRHN